MQQILPSQGTVGFAQRIVARPELCRAFHGANRMLVDRELVKVVELHKVPRVSQRRHDLFQHPQFMQPPQQFTQPRGLREQGEEAAAEQRREIDRVFAEHRRADGGPSTGFDPLVGQIRQFHEPEDSRRVAT